MAVRLPVPNVGECCAFSLEMGSGMGAEAQEGFLVAAQSGVFAYRNRCPHTGAPLNWLPEQFLNYENDMIQCALHGALFRIEDGLCVRGPCQGQSLQPVPFHREGVLLVIDLESIEKG